MNSKTRDNNFKKIYKHVCKFIPESLKENKENYKVVKIDSEYLETMCLTIYDSGFGSGYKSAFDSGMEHGERKYADAIIQCLIDDIKNRYGENK